MSGFHGNRILHQLVDELVARAGVTSFVETGTHHGHTAQHMATRHPALPIFTCEINERFLAISRAALGRYGNVRLSAESSEKFVDRLVSEKVLGDLPLFFLDAHWYDYWPLPDEVASISKLPRFIILVDDFMVPGQSQFETSAGGGGTIGEHRTTRDSRPCGMGLIGPMLPPDCEVCYPAYGKLEAYGTPGAPHLVGYAVILKSVSGTDGLKADPLHSWGGIR